MKLKSDHFDESLFNDSLFDAHRMAVISDKLNYIGVLEEFTDKYVCPLILTDDHKKIKLANPLFSLIKANNILLNPKFVHPLEHEQIYDIDTDIFTRRTIYQLQNTKIMIKSERFIDQNDQVIYSKYQFKANKAITIDLYQGINDKIDGLDVLEEHKSYEFKEISVGHEDKRRNIVLKYIKDFKHKARKSKDKTVEHFRIRTEKNRTYTVVKFVGVGSGIDTLNSKIYQEYDDIKKAHIQSQQKLLRQFRLNVVSNKNAQTRIDYAMRQLFKHPSYFPESTIQPLSIYFMVYAYLHHQPKRARLLIENEINRLPSVKDMTKDNGYLGAMYLNDPESFVEGEQHILNGAMLIYAIDYYLQYTDDLDILKYNGIEMMVEICLFYFDYATFIEKKNHYAFLNVANIDGTIQHIDYHILTHFLVRLALFKTKKLIQKLKYKISASKLKKINQLYHKIYIPQPNVDDLFFPYRSFLDDFENKRLVTDGKKIDITADHLLIFMIFEHKYNEKVVKKNIDFYRKHFTNSLNNQWIQSIIPRTERLNLSITQFNKVTSLKRNSLLVGEKGFDIGACALVYYVLVYCYAGLRKQNQYFSVDTNIPGNIRRLEFWINFKDHLADIKIKRNSARFEWRKED